MHFDLFNTQGQPKLAWPASFVVARAYVDQLARSNGLSANQIASVRQSLATAEQASGTARSSALTQLATQLDGDASGAKNPAKVQALASEVRSLATVFQLTHGCWFARRAPVSTIHSWHWRSTFWGVRLNSTPPR